MNSEKRSKVPAPPADLQLQKRFFALVADERLVPLCNKASGLAKSEPHRGTGKKKMCDSSGRLSPAGDGGPYRLTSHASWGGLLLPGDSGPGLRKLVQPLQR